MVNLGQGTYTSTTSHNTMEGRRAVISCCASTAFCAKECGIADRSRRSAPSGPWKVRQGMHTVGAVSARQPCKAGLDRLINQASTWKATLREWHKWC
jgi:hypothetical protein